VQSEEMSVGFESSWMIFRASFLFILTENSISDIISKSTSLIKKSSANELMNPSCITRDKIFFDKFSDFLLTIEGIDRQTA
jgi:hypothetical protein